MSGLRARPYLAYRAERFGERSVHPRRNIFRVFPGGGDITRENMFVFRGIGMGRREGSRLAGVGGNS